MPSVPPQRHPYVRGAAGHRRPVLTECFEIRRRVMPEGHWLIWNAQSLLGETLTAQSRFVEAEAMLVEAAERMEPPKSIALSNR